MGKTEMAFLQSLDDAFENGRFEAYYQPIYNSANAEIVSAEVLSRCYDEKGKLISPNVFIPLLEKHYQVTRLDRFIWEQACIFLKTRKETGEKQIPLSVNISRLDFFEFDLPSYIINLTEKYNIDPSLFHIEITESAYTKNVEKITQDVTKLREHGFKAYMDDFGSGYSSLNMLMNLSIDVIKIDRALTMNIEKSEKARRILGSIIRMGQWLGMRTLAEGVETQEQVRFLRGLGCDLMQGFYFSKPVPAREFLTTISKKNNADLSSIKLPEFDIEKFALILAENPIIDMAFNMAGALSVVELDVEKYEFHVIKANDRFYQNYTNAFARNQMLMYSLDIVYKDDRKIVKDAIKQAIETGKVVSADYRLWTKKIKFKINSLKLKYLGEQGGKPYFLVFTHHYKNE